MLVNHWHAQLGRPCPQPFPTGGPHPLQFICHLFCLLKSKLQVTAAKCKLQCLISDVIRRADALQGALQHMGEPELQHWMRMACCRTLATSAKAVRQLVQDHGQRPNGQQLPVQVSFT